MKYKFTELTRIFAALFLLVTLYADGADAAPVFVKEAALVEKDFVLELYGNFVHEEVTTIYSPIVGIIKKINVAKGERVNTGRVLFSVLRDDPGFTREEKMIKAPFTGIVKTIFAYEGSRISPQTPVMVIGSFDPIYLYAAAAEDDLAKIRVGAGVTIKVSYLQDKLTGEITNILDVDAARRVAPVKIRVANRQNLIAAGSEGKIFYSYGKREIVLIPGEAVFAEKGRYFAWVKKGDKAEKREIAIGELTEGGFECNAGIAAGEEVIYYGYLDLKPGDLVKTVKTAE
jgi:multidrug efflux pump subunit AcrA (membrane-fusion protein)